MARKNENVEQQRVVDSEGQTAPVGGTQQAQPAQAQPAQQQPQQAQPAQREQAEGQQERQVSGTTNIKYVGRGVRYLDGENEYENGQVVEVDAETANRLLSAKDAHARNQFVQAD